MARVRHPEIPTLRHTNIQHKQPQLTNTRAGWLPPWRPGARSVGADPQPAVQEPRRIDVRDGNIDNAREGSNR